jgi:hypothetical protein
MIGSDEDGLALLPFLMPNDLRDWSMCKPFHRQTRIPWGEGMVAVEAPGEPARWIFTISPGTEALQLVEVQYVLRMKLKE